jgi:hypothetical protein
MAGAAEESTVSGSGAIPYTGAWLVADWGNNQPVMIFPCYDSAKAFCELNGVVSYAPCLLSDWHREAKEAQRRRDLSNLEQSMRDAMSRVKGDWV